MIDANLQRIFQQLADCIDAMGLEASRDSQLFGLRGFPEYRQQRATTHWEEIMTHEIATRCSFESEPAYPEGVRELIARDGLPRGWRRPRGDLLIFFDDGSPLFVECKSIFECVIRKFKEPFSHNGGNYYYDYLARDENVFDDPQTTQTCISIQQAWIDARKLNCLREPAESKYHLGLLLLEFDRKQHELSSRPDYNDLQRKLRGDGWFCAGRRSWDDKVPERAKRGFQEHVGLWVKPADAA